MQKIQFFEFTSSRSVAGMFESSFSKVWEHGGVWGVLSLSSEKIESERVGSLLKDTVLDLIMNSVEEDRIKLFTEVLNKTRATLEKTVNEEDLSEKDIRLNIGLVLIIDSTLYFGKLGTVGFIIERNGKVLDIAEQLKKDEPVVISGNFEEDDIMVLLAEKADLTSRKDQKWQDFSESAGFLIGEAENEMSEDVSEPREDLPDFKLSDSNNEEIEIKSEVVGKVPIVDEEIGDTEDILHQSANPNDPKNFVRSKVKDFGHSLTQSISNIGNNLFPKLKIFFVSVYAKIGRGVTWIGETIIGPGKRVRYKMPGGDLYKRRRMILIALILIAGTSLYFSLNWLKKKNFESNQIKEYETLSTEIEAILSDAESQVLINKTEALKLLNNASSQIELMSGLEIANNRWEEFTSRKSEIEDKIDNRVRIEKPEVIADLKIWFENADPSDLVYYAGSLWLTDPTAKALYKVVADSREVEQVLSAGDGLGEPRYLEIVEDKFFIYDAKKGVLEYDLENNKLREVTGLSPTNLGNVAEISSYDSSLYFLASDSGKILKAGPAGSGFAYPQTRLQDESFKNAKDLEINGLIYTLGGGELIRYYVDTRDSQLAISGLNPKLGTADKFELLSSLKVLLLDTENKRVVVLDQPDGSSSIFKLHKQYTILESEDRYFNDLKEIVVAPAENTAYILDGFRVIKLLLNE